MKIVIRIFIYIKYKTLITMIQIYKIRKKTIFIFSSNSLKNTQINTDSVLSAKNNQIQFINPK